MDSATRIQRYVISELGDALGLPALRGKYVATSLAVLSAAGLAIFAGTHGSGGLILWPVFGVMNQLLACLTFLILNTWLAKRGRPVIYTTIPMIFLVCTVSWAAVGQFRIFAADMGRNWHLMLVLGIGLVLEGWMIVEGVNAFRLARRVRAGRFSVEQTQLALAGPSGAIIDPDGVIRNPGESLDMPDCSVC